MAVGTPPLPLELTPHSEALLLSAIAAVLTTHCTDSSSDMLEVATESILADVMDDGVPADAVTARERFEPILFSYDVSPPEDDDDDDNENEGGGGGGIFAALRAAIARAVKEEEDEDAYLSRNQCEMCERTTPLTRHHLFPRSQVKHFQKRGFCPPGRSLDEVAAVGAVQVEFSRPMLVA